MCLTNQNLYKKLLNYLKQYESQIKRKRKLVKTNRVLLVKEVKGKD